MPVAPAEIAAESLPLEGRARNNLARNAAALGSAVAMPPLQFCLARDGSLTAFDTNWLGGISVPRRAGDVMLRSLTVSGNVACLVLPVHAQQIVACLARLPTLISVIALLGGEAELAPVLACHDFSPDLTTGRLMFAWDELSLTRLFADHPGLPIPQQFVRLATSTGDQADPVMKMAKNVFAPVVQQQGDRVRRAAALPVKHDGDLHGDLCVVGSGTFALWDDATAALVRIAGGEFIDTDVAAQSASAHIAERIAASRAIVTADLGRSDRPELMQMKQPWISWITCPRVPAFQRHAPNDGLLLADEQFAPLAAAAGWPANRVGIAAFPAEPLPPPGTPTGTVPLGTAPVGIAPVGIALALIADLPSLTPPDQVTDFSSWRVAWDTIAAELQADPFRLGNDAGGYLDRILRRCDIDSKNLPRDLFLNRLIQTAFTIGIARLVQQRRIPVAIYGDGWDGQTDLNVLGPVTDRHMLLRVLADSRAVIDCSLSQSPALRDIDRPVIRVLGLSLPSLIAKLRSPPIAPCRLPRLSAELIQSLL